MSRKRTAPTRVSLVAPDAEDVRIAGDFNNWNQWSHPLLRGPDGVWTRELDLPPGRHEYKFVVDGRWCCADGGDPPNDGRSGHAPNEFGTMNIVVLVHEAAAGRRTGESPPSAPGTRVRQSAAAP